MSAIHRSGLKFSSVKLSVTLLAVMAMAMGMAHALEAPASLGAEDARHLLARTGFGPTQAEIRTYAGLTREQAVARMLGEVRRTAGLAAPGWIDEAITSPREIRNAPEERRAELRQQENQLNNRRTFELRAWWINEMLATPAPLVERMTLFWHNHFTSSQQKVRFAQLMYRQNALLRENALGNFATLLHAASKDPAMIIYLDSASNRRDKPNENFAREVMELFTLGEGNYSETDIREAARAFTGWSVDIDSGAFVYRRAVHDYGSKTILGKSGHFDGGEVLDILLTQTRTAEYIVEKMWREFVSPLPDRREVQRVARAFRDSGYEIKVALRELLLSQAFWADDNRAVLVKSPAEFVVGTLRQFDVPVPDATPFAFVMAGLGQSLFAPPNVKGWAGGEAWINSATLLARKQFVERLFRADEMGRPRMARGMDGMEGMEMAAAAAKGGPLPIVPIRGRAAANAVTAANSAPAAAPGAPRRAAPAGPIFDGQRWFSGFSGQRDPAVEQLVLAAAPANPVPAEVAGREWLRHLTLDPAYQLK